MQREKAVQAQTAAFLRSLGAVVYVLGTRRRRGDFQGTMQSAGLPDLLAFLPERSGSWPLRQFLAIECKAARGRLRPEQRRFAELCGDAEVAHVVGGLQDVITWLIEENYLRPDQVAHYYLTAGASVS